MKPEERVHALQRQAKSAGEAIHRGQAGEAFVRVNKARLCLPLCGPRREQIADELESLITVVGLWSVSKNPTPSMKAEAEFYLTQLLEACALDILD